MCMRDGCMYQYNDDSFMLHTDLYQINMAKTYYEQGIHERQTIFDLYFRKMPFDNGYAVFAGLTHIIDYLQKLHFSDSDIEYLRTIGYDDDFLKYLESIFFTGTIRSFSEGYEVFKNLSF